jgi:hypothetical protein
MALVGGIILVLSLFVRSIPLDYAALAALAVACFIGPLTFLLNGGLGRKQDLVRFYFKSTEVGRPFYLEVLPAEEPALRQALIAAGLGVKDAEANP